METHWPDADQHAFRVCFSAMSGLVEAALRSNESDMDAELTSAMRREEDPCTVLLGVLKEAGVSLFQPSWTEVCMVLQHRVMNAEQYAMSSIQLKDALFALEHLKVGLKAYSDIVQECAHEYFRRVEKDHLDARSRVMSSLSIAGAFRLKLLKKSTSAQAKMEGHATLRMIRMAVERAEAPSAVHQAVAPVRDIRRLLEDPNAARLGAFAGHLPELEGQVQYRRSVQILLKRLISQFHQALLDVRKSWAPRVEMAARAKALQTTVLDAVTSVLKQLQDCREMLLQDPMNETRTTQEYLEDHGLRLFRESQCTEAMKYLEHLRDAQLADAAASRAQLAASGEPPAMVERRVMKIISDNVVNTANELTRSLQSDKQAALESAALAFRKARMATLRGRFVFDWLQQYEAAFHRIVSTCGTAVGDPVMAKCHSDVRTSLTDLYKTLKSVHVRTAAHLEELKSSRIVAAVGSDAASLQEGRCARAWIKAKTDLDCVAYCIAMTDHVRLQPQHLARTLTSALDAFRRPGGDEDRVSLQFPREHDGLEVAFERLEVECESEVRAEVRIFAAPMVEEFEQTIKVMCERVATSIVAEMNELKRGCYVSLLSVATPLDVHTRSVQGLLDWPQPPLTEDRKLQELVASRIARMKQVEACTARSIVVTQPDARKLLETFLSLRSEQQTISRAWVSLQLLYFAVLLDDK
jgi:hypothetical protein